MAAAPKASAPGRGRGLCPFYPAHMETNSAGDERKKSDTNSEPRHWSRPGRLVSRQDIDGKGLPSDAETLAAPSASQAGSAICGEPSEALFAASGWSGCSPRRPSRVIPVPGLTKDSWEGMRRPAPFPIRSSPNAAQPCLAIAPASAAVFSPGHWGTADSGAAAGAVARSWCRPAVPVPGADGRAERPVRRRKGGPGPACRDSAWFGCGRRSRVFRTASLGLDNGCWRMARRGGKALGFWLLTLAAARPRKAPGEPVRHVWLWRHTSCSGNIKSDCGHPECQS